jgi:hypothetical protein
MAPEPGHVPRPDSLFDLDRGTLVDGIVMAALESRAFPLAFEDHLLLCDDRWLH